MAALGLALAAASATAAGPALAPHVYGVRISGASIKLFNATWLLEIKRTSFRLARNGTVGVSGSARIAGNRITFRDLGGSLACKGSQAVGTYSWRLAGKKLTFTRVADACVGRRLILSVAYTRVR